MKQRTVKRVSWTTEEGMIVQPQAATFDLACTLSDHLIRPRSAWCALPADMGEARGMRPCGVPAPSQDCRKLGPNLWVILI
jgi:hypothetical protein